MFELFAFSCPLGLTYNGRPVALRLMERVILIALMCAKEYAVPAPALADRLWHGEPVYGASGTLRTHIHHIRRAVAAVAGPAAGTAFLETSRVPGGGAYRLAVSAASVDVRRWERELAAARKRLLRLPGLRAEAELADVIAAWGSRPFEDGSAWDFARVEQLRLASLHRDAVMELADFRMGSGRYREMVADLQALAYDYPGEFEVWERLVTGLWRAGRDMAAARACMDCTDAFHALGLDTSAVRRLHELILSGVLPRLSHGRSTGIQHFIDSFRCMLVGWA